MLAQAVSHKLTPAIKFVRAFSAKPTGLFEAELHGEVTRFFSPSFCHQQPLPALLRSVLQQLALCLAVNPQQPRTQRLVQPEEEIPVVVDEEKVVNPIQILLVLCLGVTEVHLLPRWS